MLEKLPGKSHRSQSRVSLHSSAYFLKFSTCVWTSKAAITLQVEGSLPRAPPHSGIGAAGGWSWLIPSSLPYFPSCKIKLVEAGVSVLKMSISCPRVLRSLPHVLMNGFLKWGDPADLLPTLRLKKGLGNEWEGCGLHLSPGRLGACNFLSENPNYFTQADFPIHFFLVPRGHNHW